MMHVRYLWYMLRHKWYVLLAGSRLRVPLRALIIHDWTKFTSEEWGPYARRFYGGRAGLEDKDGDPTEFLLAFGHHWLHNPHHWEFWVDNWPTRMPDVFVREMVADWCAAGRAITGSWDLREWYEATRDKRRLHPATLARVEGLLAIHEPWEW